VRSGGTDESAEPGPAASPLRDNQMVVFYGTPLAAGLGILGMFSAEEAADRVHQQAALYDEMNGERGVLPAFDLIYAIAADEPTSNGLYLRYLDPNVVDRYVRVAEERGIHLILDLQIGRGNVTEEVRKIEQWLVHPNVHVAIDPEYAVGPHGAPILTPGQISGHDINEVQDYVSSLVDAHDLPPKMVIIHQFMAATIVEGEATRHDDNVDLVLNMDAFGPTDEKRKQYHFFAAMPYAEHKSFNIFLKQDDRVLSEQEVLDLTPSPDVIFYQ
jgi:hypothetical protein